MLTNIKIKELYAHPQNPRKNIGDVTELAESLKNQGIFQNLTVVKGGPGVPEGQNGYTVIIGHRRMAAAKLAGLEELPCLIAQMDEKQQVATMLLENMQRSDLSIYEQAQGFQMMLDLGETQQSIAEKTGFSQTTVHRRLELAKLDQSKLENASQRQISIANLDKLSQIESIEKRNELLKDIGTSNFEYRVNSAINNEKQKKKEEQWRQILLNAGLIEIDDHWDPKYAHCSRSYLTCSADENEYVRADDEKYFKISYGSIYFRQDRVERVKTKKELEKEKEQELVKKRRDMLEEMSKSTYELRKQFVQSVSVACIKKHLADIVSFLCVKAAIDDVCINDVDVFDLFGIEPSEEDEEDMSAIFSEIYETVKKSPEKYLWKMVCLSAEDSDRQNYYTYWGANHCDNLPLTAFYDLLVKMGYQMSDDEKQLRDGTHPIFTKAEE